MEAMKIAVLTETVPIFPQDTDPVSLRYLEKIQDYEVENEVLVLENRGVDRDPAGIPSAN